MKEEIRQGKRLAGAWVSGFVVKAACVGVMLMAGASVLQAVDITRDEPDFDRWNYPFNGTPGTRGTAPTFGAIGSTFDNHDGQFLIGFNVSGLLPLLGAGEFYRVTALTVTATHASGSFLYDPTYDGYRTHLDAADPDFLADDDPGRPVMLTGAGLRTTSGYTAFSFTDAATNAPPFYGEGESYGFGDPTQKDVRSAFAFDPNSVGPSNPFGDISNNIDDAFDFMPFAMGTTSVAPGAGVIEASPGLSPGSTFTFAVDVGNAGIQSYLSDSLQSTGALFFTITSLHSTGEMTGGTNPNFYTRDNFDPAAVPATLSLSVQVVPEPGTAALLAVAAAVLSLRRRVRRTG